MFQTQAASNPNLVSEIIAANGGVILDTPNFYDNGTKTLTSADFNTISGEMTWWGAQAWANNLNLGGYTDWALPTTVPGVIGHNQTGSQLGDLYYNQLGGFPLNSNSNYDLFFNVQSPVYWSSTEYAPNPDDAWNFGIGNGGYQDFRSKDSHFYAWAVRMGDVAAVPLPGAVWLFLSGMICFMGLKRRSHIS